MWIISSVSHVLSLDLRFLLVSITNDNAQICRLSMESWNQCATLQLLPISIIMAKQQYMFDIEPRMRYFDGKVLHLLVSIIMIIGIFAV